MAAATGKSTVYHGHLVLLSTFALNFVAIGAFNSAGLYLAPLSDSFPRCGSGALALYCTVQIAAGLVSSLAGGAAQDALDSRGAGPQWLFFGGGALMGLGFLCSSVSSTLVGVLTGSLLTGTGLGLGGFLAGGIAVLWFEAARGRMLLLAMSGQGVGNVFFAYATARLLEANRGDSAGEDAWRPTMRWMGLLSFVLSAAASVCMRMPLPGEVEEYERGGGGAAINGEGESASTTENNITVTYGSLEPTSTKDTEGQQSSMRMQRRRSSAIVMDQLILDSGFSKRQSAVKIDRRRSSTMLGSFQAISNAPLLTLSDFVHSERTNDLRSYLGEMRDVYDHSLKEISLTTTNVCLNAFMLVACFAFLNMQVLLPPYMQSIGLPPSAGGRALIMFGVGDFLSNLTLGAVADALGARRLLAAAFAILSALYFAWTHCATIGSLSTMAFLYGYFCCTIGSMPLIILADAFSETSSEHILTLNGVSNMFKLPGYLLGPFLAGELVERSGGYDVAAVCSGLASLAGAIVLLLIPPPEKQRRLLQERAKSILSEDSRDSWGTE